MKAFFAIYIDAAELWYERDADHMAAVVAYYSLFAITPLLFLTITIAGALYSKDVVGEILIEWGRVLGPDLVNLLWQAVSNLGALSENFLIPLLGAIFFSGMVIVLFNAFSSGLHHLWNMPHQGIRGWLKKCRNSFYFALVLQIYLIVVIGINLFISFLAELTGWNILLASKIFIFVGATTILFSLMYRILPWQAPGIKDRLYGAFVASILFLVAKIAVAAYVSMTPLPGLFGIAGLLLALLIWIYVSAAIVYYGAAIAHVRGTIQKN